MTTSQSHSKATATGGTYHTKAHPAAGAGAGDAGSALLSAIAGQTKTGKGGISNAEYRKLYKVMHIGVGVPAIGNKPASENYAKYELLMEHAARLKVTESDIVWAALDMFLATPPDQLVARARGAKGSRPGFWVVPQKGEGGRALGFSVVEVEARLDMAETGTTFFPFEEGNAKARARARRAAVNKASSDMQLCGLKGKVDVEEFVTDVVANATAAPSAAGSDPADVLAGLDDDNDGDDDSDDGSDDETV